MVFGCEFDFLVSLNGSCLRLLQGCMKFTRHVHKFVFFTELCVCACLYSRNCLVGIHPAAWENPNFFVVLPGGAAHREGGGRGRWVGGLFKDLSSY